MPGQNSKIAQALRLHQAGDVGQAEALYREILNEDASHADANHYLGVIAHQFGQLDAAAALIARAISVRPDYVEAYTNLANTLKAQNKDGEAISCLQKALALRPDYAEGHANLGVLLKGLGKFEDALSSLDRSIRLKPDFLAAHFNRANLLKERNRMEEARDAYQKVLALQPQFVDGHLNLGSLYEAMNEPRKARQCYEQAMKIDPKSAEALCNLAALDFAEGELDKAQSTIQQALNLNPEFAQAHRIASQIYRAQENHGEAISRIKRAIELSPDNAGMYNTLGLIYLDQEKDTEAVECFEKALGLDPDYSDAHGNLANVQRKQNQPKRAREHYLKALRLNPNSADIHNNFGTLLKDEGEIDLALASYKKATELKPDFADALNNLGHTQLLMGNFEEGWKHYHWRWKMQSLAKHVRTFEAPQWDGTLMENRTLYVYPEQGLGDFIQFVRYMPLIAERVGKLVLEVPRALEGLYKTVPGTGNIISHGQSPGPIDAHIPLLDIPLLLGTDINSIPPALGLERFDCEKEWQERLSSYAGQKIGLVWAGNPDHQNDKNRSLDPASLLPLTELEDVSLFSLQVGTGSTCKDVFGEQVTDLAPQLTSFVETAAAMRQLDLIISVDSSPAHLAGTLGVPVWTLLPFMPDWRWMMGRDDSPWYPSMRLFRQPAPGDWDSVIHSLKDAVSGAGS